MGKGRGKVWIRCGCLRARRGARREEELVGREERERERETYEGGS